MGEDITTEEEAELRILEREIGKEKMIADLKVKYGFDDVEDADVKLKKVKKRLKELKDARPKKDN